MSKAPAPKLKADYVTAIAERCGVLAEDLAKHTVDRPKSKRAAVRPPKAAKILPTGWKKANLDTSRAVRGVGGAGSQPKHRGPSLARVEEEPVSSGDRDLDAGSRGGAREECTRGGTSDTIVPDMSNPNDEANKWLDRPGFLRMFEVPGMQKDPQSDLWWPTHGSRSEGLGCKESSEEGDTDRDGDGSRIWQEGIQTSSEASNLNRFVEPGRRDESRCGLDMEPKFNMNITKEEMALIMQQRESTAVKHPVPEQ